MKRKRTTKPDRDAADLGLLKLQFRLIYAGIEGEDADYIFTDQYFASASALSRAIPCIAKTWGLNDQETKLDHTTKPHCLDQWESPDKAAEWLFEMGVRPLKEKTP